MSFVAVHTRRIWPRPWGAALRDRLQFFRLLTLLLALLTLWGVALAFGVHLSMPVPTVTMGVAAILLSALWTHAMRQGEYRRWWLPFEALLLLAFMYGIQDDFGPFGTMYVALQHRALFGSRRDAVVAAFTYAGVLVFGHLFLPGGLRGVEPGIIVVELAVGGFAAYLMHALAEVLERDRARNRALRDSEQRFRSVIENLREALIITDLDDRITLANQRVRELLGYGPEELVGRTVTDLVADGVMRAAFGERLEKRKQGASELYEADLLHKDGHVINAEISAAPYRDATGVIVGSQGAITDVSSRKQMEERLRQASRMEAIGQLAGGVAHDFNNLLTVIKVHTELLLGDLGSTDPNRVSIVEIERSADRAASLTQQLLAFSRKQLLQPRLIRLEDVVARCESNLRSLIDDGVSLTMSHKETNFTVFADPAHVEQILVALVRNANDAVVAATDRRIDVRTAPTLLRELSSEPAHDIPPGQYMTLAVTDTGKGFSPEVTAQLFEPFMTTKAPGQGSGLGLASVYGAVRQGGGFIAVDSAPGAGSTFWIYFPIARRPAPIDRASHRALVA